MPTRNRLAFADRADADAVAVALRARGERPTVRPMLPTERQNHQRILPKGLTVVQWDERSMQTRIDLRPVFRAHNSINV